MDSLIPKSLDGKGAAKLEKTFHDGEAIALFDKDPLLQSALAEFGQKGISAGTYDYGGILIYLGLARCENADDAYGIYSALTSRPRERWEYGRGEMSYRSPYLSGCSGEMVFWIFSPTNPMTYADFYRRHGEGILAEFEKIRSKPGCSYHWKILPSENRFSDSIVYVKSRNIGDMEVVNAYGAAYQAKTNMAGIYVQKFDSEDEAKQRYSRHVAALAASNKTLTGFVPVPGPPLRACHWQGKCGVWILCQYRWMLFLLTDMPSVDYATNFIRIMFNNMLKVRNEAVPSKN